MAAEALSTQLTERKRQTVRCEVHGEYVSRYLEPPIGGPFWTECPSCAWERNQQESAEASAALAKASAAEKRKLDQAKLEEAMDRAGIPLRYRGKTLESFEGDASGIRAAVETCKTFRDSRAALEQGATLTLLGGPGTGKTHLSTAVANAWFDAGRTVIYLTSRALVRHIRSAYDQPGVSEAQRIAELTRPDLLIIDDIGAQQGTEHEKLLLFDVIDDRYANLRPMILVSNLPAEELAAYLGERMWDRLHENGRVVACNWSSYRRR